MGKKLDLKSALGVTKEVLFAILEAIEDAGGTQDDIRRVLIDKTFSRRLGNFFLDYPVIIDTRSIKEWIWSSNYISVDSHCERKSFPPSEVTREVIVRIIQFDGEKCMSDVLEELDNMGFRPATHLELLALGVTYSNLRRYGDIFALGTINPGPGHQDGVMSIHHTNGAYHLKFSPADGSCGTINYSYAAVRK